MSSLKLNKNDSEMVRNMMWKSIAALISEAETTKPGKTMTKPAFLTQIDEK